jgi:SAM-dependent methyltransferase
MMASTRGVRKIIAFNRHWYALALLGNLVAVVCVFALQLPSALVQLAWLGLVVGNGWLVASLGVSHWVYDRSPLARGAWLDALDASVRDVAVLHAGHDEASTFVSERLPQARLCRFDFFDPTENTELSLQRARQAATPNRETTCVSIARLPLADAALDAALVVFAAHEIRKPERLATFFCELHRVVRPAGTVIVVEHLRDGWNALAYGPGAMHFLSRRTWLRAFAVAGLHVACETRYTPFVSCFSLTRRA